LGTREGKIISIEKVADSGKVVEHSIKFLAPRVGAYEFDLVVKSNAYIGLDQKAKVALTTLDNSALPEYKIHPDDAELDDEPTLFEEMLNANIEQDSDSDDDDSDDEDEAPPKESAADAKKAQLRNARKAAAAGDDDSDDDDEVEEVFAQK
jgi:translocation protein SEC63